MPLTHRAKVSPAVTDALAAANSHDAAAFVDCFSVGAVVDAWGQLHIGLAAIDKWARAALVADAVVLTDMLFAVDDEETSVHAQMSGRGYHGPVTFAFTVEDAAIRSLSITT